MCGSAVQRCLERSQRMRESTARDVKNAALRGSKVLGGREAVTKKEKKRKNKAKEQTATYVSSFKNTIALSIVIRALE